MNEAKGGLLGFLKRKKKEEEVIDEKAPVPIHTPSAPPYSTTDGLFPSRIKFKGLYDLDGLYRLMANWLRQRRFEVYEDVYKSKPPELELRIRGERKKTGFIMEVITIYYHSYGEYDLDVMFNGKKKKMTDARMTITLGGAIVAPYEDLFGRHRWTANAVERRLLSLFKNWFLKREIEAAHWDTLYYELYKLHATIKEFLKYEAKGNAY